MSRLTIDSVTAGYARGKEVLHGVTLEVSGGEVLGVVGPNGGGKSTLVRAASRSLPVWEGSVSWDGSDVWKMSARDFARRAAVVPQEIYTPFDLDVAEVVMLGRHPHVGRLHLESRGDRDIALRMLEQVDAAELADRGINAISGGERQRVMIAKALAQEPKLLILDEPTAHLDIAHQIDTLSRVCSMARESKIAVLAVLHDLNLAAAWCDRIAVMSEGEVVAVGSPNDVISEQLIGRVWGARMWVRKHPATGRPFLLPMPPPYEPDETSDQPGPKVHVICGGGSGAGVLSALMREGYRLTCGVLNVGDSDEELCRAMNIPHVAEAPFSPVSVERAEANLKLALEADVVVVTGFCVGPGNLANLETALTAARQGRPVLCQSAADQVDYTGGAARKVLAELEAAANTGTSSSAEAQAVAVIIATSAS